MRKIIVLVGVSVFAGCGQSGSEGPQETAVASRFVGAWHLARFTRTAADGGITYPYGDPPGGQIMYTSSGQMSAQLMRPVETSAANRDFKPGFSAAMMHKDLKLAQAAANASEAATPLGAQAAALYTLFVNAGNGGHGGAGGILAEMESCSVIGLVQRRSDLVKIYGDAAIVTGYSVGTVAETGMPESGLRSRGRRAIPARTVR